MGNILQPEVFGSGERKHDPQIQGYKRHIYILFFLSYIEKSMKSDILTRLLVFYGN